MWYLISSTSFCSVSYEKWGCLCTGHAIEKPETYFVDERGESQELLLGS